MAKEEVVYIHNGILLSHKKNEILPFAMTWMEAESILLSEINQSEKDKYHMIPLMWNLRSKTNEQRKNKIRKQRGRQTKRLLTVGNKLGIAGEEVCG